METKTLEIPVIQKSKAEKPEKIAAASSCCTPKNDAAVCCTPSETKEENNGACCAQPEDGSSCCDKQITAKSESAFGIIYHLIAVKE